MVENSGKMRENGYNSEKMVEKLVRKWFKIVENWLGIVENRLEIG